MRRLLSPFRLLFWLALLAGAAALFVGGDVISAAVRSARHAAREALTTHVPLTQRLAEARRQVDAYAESVIRAQVAAKALEERIHQAEREVTGLDARVARQREHLQELRRAPERGHQSGEQPLEPAHLESKTLAGRDAAAAWRAVRAFRSSAAQLERRRSDLERMRSELQATEEALVEARSEHGRLADEVVVLAGEIESLEARKAAARTRQAVGDASLDDSGFADARQKLDALRRRLHEQNALLAYYQGSSSLLSPPGSPVDGDVAGDDPLAALEEALAAYPAR